MNSALADFRVIDYSQIQALVGNSNERLFMVSLHSQALNNTAPQDVNQPTDPVLAKFKEHDWWNKGQGWKNVLNNLRLVIQHAYLL